jgi:hypothetical protein
MARAFLLAASVVVLALGVSAQLPCAGTTAVCPSMDASVCEPSTNKFNYPAISGAVRFGRG